MGNLEKQKNSEVRKDMWTLGGGRRVLKGGLEMLERTSPNSSREWTQVCSGLTTFARWEAVWKTGLPDGAQKEGNVVMNAS